MVNIYTVIQGSNVPFTYCKWCSNSLEVSQVNMSHLCSFQPSKQLLLQTVRYLAPITIHGLNLAGGRQRHWPHLNTLPTQKRPASPPPKRSRRVFKKGKRLVLFTGLHWLLGPNQHVQAKEMISRHSRLMQSLPILVSVDRAGRKFRNNINWLPAWPLQPKPRGLPACWPLEHRMSRVWHSKRSSQANIHHAILQYGCL